MHDAAYQEITAMCGKNAGMLKTELGAMVNQFSATPENAGEVKHRAAIATSIGAMPWLAGAASDAQ